MQIISPDLAPIATAESLLLTPYNLTQGDVQRVLDSMCTRNIDYADLYFQYARSEGWSLEEGIVKSGSFNIEEGVGVRAVSGDKTAFAYSDDISLAALQDAASATAAIARQGQSRSVKSALKSTSNSAGQSGGRNGAAHANALRKLYADQDPLASLAADDKVKLLERVEKMARARDKRVTQVMASLGGTYEVIMVARGDGVVAADVRPLVRCSVTVIVEENGKRETGSSGGGGRFGYAYFTDAMLEDYAAQAVHAALTNLAAQPAPAGTMTVVLGNGWPGKIGRASCRERV